MRLFRKKPAINAITELNKSMSKVDRDIYLIQQWIAHLHGKHEFIKNSHFRHVDMTRRDVQELNRWINYLHRHNLEMHNFVKETTKNILDLRKNQEDLLKKLEKLEEGQLRTLQRTSQGQLRDMSLVDQTAKEIRMITPEINQIGNQSETKFIGKHEFTGSEMELINIFYRADRPLSYQDLSKLLGKKDKSIRNLIYELRAKKVLVKSKPIGIRTKGFFLEKEEKIRVSGR